MIYLGVIGGFLIAFLLSRPGANPKAELAPLIKPYRYSEVSISAQAVDNRYPELMAIVGTRLDCPASYAKQLRMALAFYPELYTTRIRVVSRQLSTSMAVRPTRLGLGAADRTYTIFVDDQSESAIDFRRADFSAQVGCFIHELAHILHYERCTNGALLLDGIRYGLAQSFRSRYEKQTDELAIAYGGGYYVYEFARFIFQEAGISAAYRAYKTANYYSEEDLWRLHASYRNGKAKN
jgi:hypothetical protein